MIYLYNMYMIWRGWPGGRKHLIVLLPSGRSRGLIVAEGTGVKPMQALCADGLRYSDSGAGAVVTRVRRKGIQGDDIAQTADKRDEGFRAYTATCT